MTKKKILLATLIIASSNVCQAQDFAMLETQILARESQGRTSAFNTSSGASGAHQFMPRTAIGVACRMGLPECRLSASEMSHRLRVNRAFSDRLFRFHIRELSARYSGNHRLIMIAYNAGPRFADSCARGKCNLPAETHNYLKGVANGPINKHRKPESTKTAPDVHFSYDPAAGGRA